VFFPERFDGSESTSPVALREAPAVPESRDGEQFGRGNGTGPTAPAEGEGYPGPGVAPADLPTNGRRAADDGADGHHADGHHADGDRADGHHADGDRAESGTGSGAGTDTEAGTEDLVYAQTPEGLVPVPGAQFAELPVGSIRPNPRQPRQVFDEESLAELVHSVREIGILQPVVVRRAADEDSEPRFELIMGERRLRAAQDAGLARIPAIIRETSDDALLRDALLENLHRSQLNPLEEAAAYQQLLDDFGCTHEELAGRIGRSRPQISNTIRLLKLPPLVQRRVAAGVLSAGHARALLGLEDSAAMERLAQRIVSEGLSVRAVEEVVALGDDPVARGPKRRPRPGTHTSELDDLASRLGDRLDTRVAVTLGRSRGRLSIDFASVEDLNRILGVLAPDLKGAFRGPQ
jgi:ParB family chromosome partitioning protein